MRKNVFSRLCLMATVLGLTSCYSLRNGDDLAYVGVEDEAIDSAVDVIGGNASGFNKRTPPLNSLIVCREKQCAPAELSKSREYIFNALTQLVDNNLDSTALLCEANPQSHICTNPYLTVPAKVGVTPAYVYFDGVKFVDSSIAEGKTALNLLLGYNLSYNGQTPTVCKPDKAMLYVKNNNKVVLNGNGFRCDMTSMGKTTIRIMFNIDYIDLDYGYIGGYYSIGLSGPAYGGGSGYSLIRLVKDAHPLSPALMAPEPVETAEVVEAQPVIRPEISELALEVLDEENTKAIAPVEIRDHSEAVRKPLETVGEAVDEVRAEDIVTPVLNSDELVYANPAQSMKLTPDSIVKSDRVILNPSAKDIKPYEVRDVSFGSDYEEVYVEDLDEYIK